MGDHLVASVSGRRLLARAELNVANITSVGLQVEVDDTPPRHANIIGWPLEKDEWMSLAQQLATFATLKIRQ